MFFIFKLAAMSPLHCAFCFAPPCWHLCCWFHIFGRFHSPAAPRPVHLSPPACCSFCLAPASAGMPLSPLIGRLWWRWWLRINSVNWVTRGISCEFIPLSQKPKQQQQQQSQQKGNVTWLTSCAHSSFMDGRLGAFYGSNRSYLN